MVLRSMKGFTLIELIMVIVIIAILAVVAVPKFIDLQSQAKAAAERGEVGGIRAGIYTYYAQNRLYPTPGLGGGACTPADPCFDIVLGQGAVTSDWTCDANGVVCTGPYGGTYTYTPTGVNAGNFICTGGTCPP